MAEPPDNEYGKQEAVGYAQDAGHTRRRSVAAGATKPHATRASSHKRGDQATSNQSRDFSRMTIPYDSVATSISGVSPTSQAPPARSSTMTLSTLTKDCTDEDIIERIRHLIQLEFDPGGFEAADAFQKADQKPPITPDSLAELDMPRIINNPKLRHDVNFDRELHFRPNLDGSKGRQKMQQADRYWLALAAEFFLLNYALMQKVQSPNREVYWSRVSKAATIRLPKIFAAIRDILKTLVPDYDQQTVQDRLDVDHIMQEVLNGVCDLIDLANWLSKILKNHCAPMRDAMVDSMRAKITDGAEQNDPEKLVNGLRQLMNILEAMKLDVANHQIRHMRLILIDDTINFQRRYNAHRIHVKKLNPEDAQEWISSYLAPFPYESTPLLALTRGLISDLVYKDSASFCPATFYLDADRLRGLRIELHTRIYHSVCCDVLREFASGKHMGATEMFKACDALTLSLSAIVGVTGRFAEKSANIAVEIVRLLLNLEGHHESTDVDLTLMVEQILDDRLHQDSREFREHATDLVERLVPSVQISVHEHHKMTAINLQDSLVQPATPPKQSSMGFGAHCEPALPSASYADDPEADLVRRFTHILCLHWQVWSNLVYTIDTKDKDDDSASDNGSESTIVQSRTGSPSPTVPIATAVYAPGRKWLPISVTVTDVPAGPPSRPSSPNPNEDGSANNHEASDEIWDAKNRQPA